VFGYMVVKLRKQEDLGAGVKGDDGLSFMCFIYCSRV
jgi:hypothetical protein